VLKSGHEINVPRPKPDTNSAPKADCDESTYAQAPDDHAYCCRSHENAEAEWSDELAGRRERGELNPETWPPIVDVDQFDTPSEGSVDGATLPVDQTSPPAHLTIDDLD
jgi:hypothetical protein